MQVRLSLPLVHSSKTLSPYLFPHCKEKVSDKTHTNKHKTIPAAIAWQGLLFYIYNSVAFTLQYRGFYIAIAWLLHCNSVAFTLQ